MPRRALSATRAADVLNFLAAHPEASFSYSQIAQRLGINLASTHNLLIALTECGYLTRDPEDRRFALGPALVAIGDAALRSHRAIEETRRAMRDLSRDQGKEADLTMQGDDVEFDKRILEEIKDPIVHLLRNSMSVRRQIVWRFLGRRRGQNHP